MATEGKRAYRRRKGRLTWRVVGYADDFVVLVHGTEADTAALREEIADLLEPLSLCLSRAKTRIVHMSGGFDFLGFRIQWKRKGGTTKMARLHLHRRPAYPVAEGEDSCSDRPDIAAGTRHRALSR
ncbi:hypothetical protein [Streptomyces sp. 900116325]